MPKVDFYVLEQANAMRAQLHACQLIEKAYADKKNVFVLSPSREDAERFDGLLWTYRDDSFIPHTTLHTVLEDPVPPILIGYTGSAMQPHRDLLINLSQQLPEDYQQWACIAEIVFNDSGVQQLARERYKHYRQQGCEINTHKLNVR